MCAIEIMDSILGSTTPMVNRCDSISDLKQAKTYSEAVKLRWKQIDLISRMYHVYRSIYPVMPLLHVCKHQSIRRPESTLTPLSYLNVRLDALAENIIAAFPTTINTISIGLSDLHRILCVAVHRALVHSNTAQYIA